MSIPHIGLSALTQVIPSINTTIASAAEAAGAAIDSASQSSFRKNLPLITPLVLTKHTKIKCTSEENFLFGTCVFHQVCELKEDTVEAEQNNTETTNEVDF